MLLALYFAGVFFLQEPHGQWKHQPDPGAKRRQMPWLRPVRLPQRFRRPWVESSGVSAVQDGPVHQHKAGAQLLFNYWGYFISNRYLMIFGLVMWNKSPIVGTSIPTPRSHSPTKIMCLNKLQSGKTNRCCILCPSCAQLTFWNLTQLAHCKSKIMKSPSECPQKKCEGSTIEM